jgi:hypothetical protein
MSAEDPNKNIDHLLLVERDDTARLGPLRQVRAVSTRTRRSMTCASEDE